MTHKLVVVPMIIVAFCVVCWKPYCKQVPFDPLKCIAGLMYNVKRIGVWKYEAKMSRDWPPPPHLRCSE